MNTFRNVDIMSNGDVADHGITKDQDSLEVMLVLLATGTRYDHQYACDLIDESPLMTVFHNKVGTLISTTTGTTYQVIQITR